MIFECEQISFFYGQVVVLDISMGIDWLAR
jgi:hypothetical protein